LRIVLSYPDKPWMPDVTVEDSPEACAALLRAMERGGPEPTVSRPRRQRAPNPRPETADRADRQTDVRAYRGRPSRRHRVLEVFRALAGAGEQRVSLDLIRTRFAELFPEESQENLDQVVRDLVNKTGKVTRNTDGSFSLRDDDRNPAGPGVPAGMS